ncbi:MAG: hypothetical protein ACI4JY_00610, partial [Oscillospiraceae bacterium]
CAISAVLVYNLLENHVSSPLSVLFSTFLGAIIYVISLILDWYFGTSGIISQKITKKKQKPLEKSR